MESATSAKFAAKFAAAHSCCHTFSACCRTHWLEALLCDHSRRPVHCVYSCFINIRHPSSINLMMFNGPVQKVKEMIDALSVKSFFASLGRCFWLAQSKFRMSLSKTREPSSSCCPLLFVNNVGKTVTFSYLEHEQHQVFARNTEKMIL